VSLVEDITVTQNIGFRHFLSNRQVDHINAYVLDYGSWADNEAPAWTSVYNENYALTPPGAPEPRYGLLKAETVGNGTIRVYWDLAQDKYQVDYYLYYNTTEIDFDGNPQLEGMPRIKLEPRMPEDYRTHTGSMIDSLYPFYDDVEGFTSGVKYYLAIRAVDRSTEMNMDTNESTLYLTVE